ncbi:hypothetical protein BDZ91DRAFT_722315 [Kalaharituber pfeilii]|nr:hypothetical protein BDZ91DRAFT_722315 [Kalaharituber pfeilii]
MVCSRGVATFNVSTFRLLNVEINSSQEQSLATHDINKATIKIYCTEKNLLFPFFFLLN